MSLHRNAKLGLAGRFALVSAIEGGASPGLAKPRSSLRLNRGKP
jgi:hypothetical protein